jgi:hypothetical protein
VLDHAVDVLGLQEIGDQQALDELLARLGQDWHGVLSLHPDHRGIRVAVVSRLPETDTEQVVDLPPRWRPCRVEDDGTVMTRMGRGAVQKGVQAAAGALDVLAIEIVFFVPLPLEGGLRIRGPSPALRAT